MRGKIKRVEPAGDASAVDEVRKAGKEARKMKKAAARGCCGQSVVGKNPMHAARKFRTNQT